MLQGLRILRSACNHQRQPVHQIARGVRLPFLLVHLMPAAFTTVAAAAVERKPGLLLMPTPSRTCAALCHRRTQTCSTKHLLRLCLHQLHHLTPTCSSGLLRVHAAIVKAAGNSGWHWPRLDFSSMSLCLGVLMPTAPIVMLAQAPKVSAWCILQLGRSCGWPVPKKFTHPMHKLTCCAVWVFTSTLGSQLRMVLKASA